jgi:hypothetical protein
LKGIPEAPARGEACLLGGEASGVKLVSTELHVQTHLVVEIAIRVGQVRELAKSPDEVREQGHGLR